MGRKRFIGEKKNPSGQGRKHTKGLPRVRVTDEEFEWIQKRAEEGQVSVSGYVRAQCFGPSKIKTAWRPTVDIELLGESVLQFSSVMTHLSKIGSNVHQIVKKLNFGNPITLERIYQILTEVLDNLAAMKLEVEDLSRRTRQALSGLKVD